MPAAVDAAVSVLAAASSTRPAARYRAIFVACSFVLAIACSTAIVARLARCSLTFTGGVRYTAALAVMVSPLMLVIVAGSLGVLDRGSGAAAVAVLLGLLATWVGLSIFAGWPVSQITGDRWIGPTRLWRATAGHRKGLALCAFVGAGSSDLLPDYEKVHGVGNLILLGVGRAGFATFWTVFVLAVGVAAWRMAATNEPALRGTGQVD